MTRRAGLLLALGLTACATTMGGPGPVGLTTVALRTAADAAEAGTLLRAVDAEIALVASTGDAAWFAAVAEAAGLTLSGPTPAAGGVALALMAMEPLGDTVLDLTYDGGAFTIVDALYDLDDNHFVDLMAFRVDADDAVGPLVTRLLRYIATDVPPSAAIAVAIAVPNAAKGDSLAALLSPGYFDALRCADDDAPAAAAGDIRLFYGPEARMWCDDATAERVAGGTRILADLTAGLR